MTDPTAQPLALLCVKPEHGDYVKVCPECTLAALDAAEARGEYLRAGKWPERVAEARAEGERAGREQTELAAITFLNNLASEWEGVSGDAVTALAAAGKAIRLKGLRALRAKEAP